jgi:molybdopterin-guanine dinucleotide biosynthesis protein A
VKKTLTAVLLAGGESHRFGRDKASFEIEGEPLWRRQLNLLRRLQPAELLVSARVNPSWRPDDVRFVPDDLPARGPLGGIASALEQVDGGHLLVLAVDLPRMQSKYFEKLRSLTQANRGVVPMRGTLAEPLAAIYPATALPDFEEALDRGEWSLQSLVAKLTRAGKISMVPVTAEDEPLFANLNTPSDAIDLTIR